MQEVLVYLNFNSRKYFLHCIDQINHRLNGEEALTGKLEKLAYECKVINQIQCESNIRYTTKYPSLKEVIGNWISEEMNYLDTKRQLTMIFPASDGYLYFQETMTTQCIRFTQNASDQCDLHSKDHIIKKKQKGIAQVNP